MALESGCGQHSFPSFDRLNHLHNDTNQKLAEDSLDGFGKFTSQQDGLAATLAKNLEARRQLETTVSKAKNALDDVRRAFLTTDITWDGLRRRLFLELGLPRELVNAQDLDEGNHELSERIHVRETLVAAVAKDIELLGKLEHSILEQAKADAKRAQDDLNGAQKEADTKGTPVGDVPIPDATTAADRKKLDQLRCQRINWALGVVQAFRDAGQQLKENDALRAKAGTIQGKLLDEIQASRDPAGAYAIVALLGTGLGEDDFVVLEGYLGFLDAKLQAIKPPEDAGLTPDLVAADLEGIASDVTERTKDPEFKAADARTRETLLAQARDQAVQDWNVRLRRSRQRPPEADDAAWFQLNAGLLEAQQATSLARRLAWERLQVRKGAIGEAKRLLYSRAKVPAPALGSADAARLNTRVKRFRATQSTLDYLFPTAVVPTVPADQKANEQRAGEASRPAAAAPRAADAVAPAVAPAAPAPAANDQRIVLQMATVRHAPVAVAQPRRVLAAPLRPLTTLAKTNAPLTPVEKDLKASVDSGHALLGDSTTTIRETRVTLEEQYKSLRAVVQKTSKAVIAVKKASQKRATTDAKNASADAGAAASDECKVTPPDNLDLTQLQGFELLKLALSADPKLVVKLGELVHVDSISADQLKIVGQFANDVTQEVLDAKVRVRQFLDDLSRIQVDTAAENVRHYETMLAIAEMEAKRWQLIGHLDSLYYLTSHPEQYPPPPPEIDVPRSNDPFDHPDQVPLFRTAGQILNGDPELNEKGFYSYYLDTLTKRKNEDKSLAIEPDKFGKPASAAQDHPPVYVDESVFLSIRKLADTARELHKKPQMQIDPLGWHLAVANVRLQKAVLLVDGQLLMLSLNEHLADENAIRLQSEIAEHDVNLDGLDGRAREAGFRLSLGDLKAFHHSGITQSDIQAIESAILVWIGAKVN